MSNANSTTLESLIEFNGTNGLITNVRFDKISIDANSNAYSGLVAFKIYGIFAYQASCVLDNVIYSEAFISNNYIKTDGFKDKSTVIAHKTAAQLIYPVPSRIVWDTVESDEQDVLLADGRFVIEYQAAFAVRGKISILGLSAGNKVTFEFSSTHPAMGKQQCHYIASGADTETFDFDFSGVLGVNQTTRDYQVIAFYDGPSSISLDVSDPGLNRLTVERIKV